MVQPSRSPAPRQWPLRSLQTAAAALLVVAVLVAGLRIRLEDPGSSPVMAAEDTYTHMALVREHLRDGNLDPLYESGDLYPPGMHAAIAAVSGYSGISLYSLMVYGPVLLGLLGLAGLALLLWRGVGPVAAVVGTLALALAPEPIFRTTMMSPTALDLALLPFFLHALLATVRGQLAWSAVTAVLALFLAFSHPWVFAILGPAGLVFLLMAIGIRWPSPGPHLSPMGVASGIAILGIGTSLALVGCMGGCGNGFANVLPNGEMLMVLAPIAALFTLAPLAWATFAPASFARLLDAAPRPLPFWGKAAISICLGVLVLALTVPALIVGFPGFVDLPRMFGWPMLLLAFTGLLVAPFQPRPVTHVGLAIVLVTYPFVVNNPLDSAFWPHRTAVYLGVGLAVLTGAAASAITAGLVKVVADRAKARAEPVAPRRRQAILAASALLVAVALGAGLAAAAPQPYAWYRLYDECEFEGLRDIAQDLDADSEAVAIAGSWQPKLVLAAMASNASRSWFDPAFFTDAEHRQGILDGLAADGRTGIVVVDHWLLENETGRDLAFLQEPRYRPAGTWCQGPDGARLRAYEVLP